ncbi:hypothetical protein I204_03072 [Kwoniella mangroviensis CBS 8886]|nr:hypothetical protein I204_03072 [Kwoniella mangroviensis CBS 8886]
MVAECGLYALLDGPTNLNIIAFDDVWRSPDVTGQLALLKKDTGLEIASGDAIVLQEMGYKGGNFTSFCESRLNSSSLVKTIKINQPFALKTRPSKSTKTVSSPQFEGCLAFSLVEDQSLRV